MGFSYFFRQSVIENAISSKQKIKKNIDAYADKVCKIYTSVSVLLLLILLVMVVGLAGICNSAIELGVQEAVAPKTVVDIAIAILALIPEALEAVATKGHLL